MSREEVGRGFVGVEVRILTRCEDTGTGRLLPGEIAVSEISVGYDNLAIGARLGCSNLSRSIVCGSGG